MGVETTQDRQRVTLLNVPVDIVTPDRMETVVYGLLAAGKEQNIVLLSLWDLLRARRSNEYRKYVMQAGLVIPISKSIVSGMRFLSGKKSAQIPVRYMPFDFVISLLGILEKRELSTYLLGSKKKTLQKTEKNIRQTFPRLRIVGRFNGYFRRFEEATIIEAIRKASPSLLLAGKGVRGEERWIARNSSALGGSLRLWCSDIFEVFAERKKHPSRTTFEKGLDWVGYCFQNPFKFLRIFPFIYYCFLLLFHKLFLK